MVNLKVLGSIPHKDSKFFFSAMLMTRGKKNLSLIDFDVCFNSSKFNFHGFCMIIQIMIFALWFPVEIFTAVFFLSVCYGSKFT